MKILAIDPGVINFSYCLMDSDTEKIYKWNTICIGKSTDPNDKLSLSLYNNLNELQLLTISDPKGPQENIKKGSLKPGDPIPEDPSRIMGLFGKPILKNGKSAKKILEDLKNTIILKEEEEKEEEEEEGEEIVQEVVKEIKREDIIVVIELQPKTNLKTLQLSGQIMLYYTIEKLKNLSTNYNIIKICNYHAANKLRYFEKLPEDPEINTDFKSSYYTNKKVSEQYCKIMLLRKKENEWLIFFENLSKKDDASDSYNMALSYIIFEIKKLSNNSSNAFKKRKFGRKFAKKN